MRATPGLPAGWLGDLRLAFIAGNERTHDKARNPDPPQPLSNLGVMNNFRNDPQEKSGSKNNHELLCPTMLDF